MISTQVRPLKSDEVKALRVTEPWTDLPEDSPLATTLGAFHNGRLIGHVQIHRRSPYANVVDYMRGLGESSDVPEIRGVRVHPEFRGEGVAGDMVHVALGSINPRVHKHAVLEVDLTNDQAVRSYVGQGFTWAAMEPFVSEKTGALSGLMVKDLAPERQLAQVDMGISVNAVA